jgi:NAD(P)-dependent dehydrogenase (short-subunit alcohol dehydrogenase family)
MAKHVCISIKIDKKNPLPRELIIRILVVITEARADSYGAQVAMGLAHGRPARLVLLGRSAEPIQSVLDEIRRASPETVSYFVSLNLQDLDSVREAARSIQQLTDAVHGLINCAGLVSREVPSRPPPNGDTERPLASNHVGHFLLTNLLRPQLAAAQGRVCNMSSRKHVVSRPSFEDVKFNVRMPLTELWYYLN